MAANTNIVTDDYRAKLLRTAAVKLPPFRTLGEDAGALVILDQTRLPQDTVVVRLSTLDAVAQAITTMQVRGAPLIGVTAAFGVALALSARNDATALTEALSILSATRPTAVNLQWALSRMAARVNSCPAEDRAQVAWEEARAIAIEDERANAAIGQAGLTVLAPLRPKGRPLQVMTHCNAGWLATVAHGTALSPLYAAHSAGWPLHVWVSETRPRNQGLLTAWELAQAHIPHTLIADNAAGLLMSQGQVDCVLVGADRVAANGDVANKVGTYLKALAAREHGIPFYVAAPQSTIDGDCPSGALIPIEHRPASELGEHDGLSGLSCCNPAFDITPAALIRGLITERGVRSWR